MVRVWFVLCLLIVLHSGSFATEKVYFGLFRQDMPQRVDKLHAFQRDYGYTPSLIMWYLDWQQPFPTADCQMVRDYGAVPHIVWEPWVWGEDASTVFSEILSGKWDSYIKTWAAGIKNYRDSIFIRFAHEFNIEGYPWCIVHDKDKTCDIYIKTFRYVVDLVRREGGTNAKWVWCPMNYSTPPEDWNDYVLAYPGDDYVDWIGIDGYNWGKSMTWSFWQTFEELFQEPVRVLSQKFPTKPIMVAEFSADSSGGDKANWITNIPAYLKTTLKNIKAINWFDIRKEADWRIASTPETSESFKKMLRDPIFTVKSPPIDRVMVNYIVDPRKRSIPIYYAKQSKIMDGRLDDWGDNLFSIMGDFSDVSVGAPSWLGVRDLSGRIQLNWDKTNLYFAAYVVDDVPFKTNKRDGDVWNGDAIELCLGLNPSANAMRTAYNDQDFQIGLSPGNYRYIRPILWSWQLGQMPDGAEIFVQPHKIGYTIEAKIPWGSLCSYYPKVGDVIGFTCALDDADSSYARETQVMFCGNYLFYKDPSGWGSATFVKDR